MKKDAGWRPFFSLYGKMGDTTPRPLRGTSPCTGEAYEALLCKGDNGVGTLSAKLTEGLFYRSINIRANATKVTADLVVGDAEN